MARYTPQFIESLRHDYEDTDEPMPAIAARHEISLRTLHRMVERGGWAKRGDQPPRTLPAAVALLRAAETLAPPEPPENAGTWSAAIEPRESASTAERLERLLLQELEAEESVRARLGKRPRSSADAARVARTLSTLTNTLQTLRRLHDAPSRCACCDDDDMPEGIDAFRVELARRIDEFVASRTAQDAEAAEQTHPDAGPRAGGQGETAALDEAHGAIPGPSLRVL